MVDIEKRMDDFYILPGCNNPPRWEEMRNFIRELVKDVRNEHDTDDKGLLKVVNATLGRDFRTLPHGYKKTLELFTLEEIEKSLKNLMNDEWHSDKYQTLKIDYLLRATTIDKFRQSDITTTRQRLNLKTGKMESF